MPSPGIAKKNEISQARYFRYQNTWILQAGKKHLQEAHGVQKGGAGKWPQERPEKGLWRVPHKVQGEVDLHAPGEGEEPDVLGEEGQGREEHQEEQGVGYYAAHVGAAEDYQAQGFVYDVGKHGAQSQKGQAHVV